MAQRRIASVIGSVLPGEIARDRRRGAAKATRNQGDRDAHPFAQHRLPCRTVCIYRATNCSTRTQLIRAKLSM